MRTRALSTDFVPTRTKAGFGELIGKSYHFSRFILILKNKLDENDEFELDMPVDLTLKRHNSLPKRKTSYHEPITSEKTTSQIRCKSMNKIIVLEKISEDPVDHPSEKNVQDIKIEVISDCPSPGKVPRNRIYSLDDCSPGHSSSIAEVEKGAEVNDPVSARRQPTSVNEKFCRICFEGEEEKEKGALICPCLCNGSLKHIHEECLRQWLVLREEEDDDDNYMIGGRCEICQYMYHITVEKKLKFSCERACGDGFPSLLVAVGLMVCLLNLVWLVYKYLTGAKAEELKHQNDPTPTFIENQRFINKMLLLLTGTIGLMFFVPIIISIKQAFFHRKVVSVKFFDVEQDQRSSKPQLQSANQQNQSDHYQVGNESTNAPSQQMNENQIADETDDNSIFGDTTSFDNTHLEASSVMPLNLDQSKQSINLHASHINALDISAC